MAIGFDNDPLNYQLLLSLTFEEMVGTITHDRAKPAIGAGAVMELHHTCVLNGVPTWNQLGNGLPYLEFNPGNPDFLDCPAADTQDLDFTTEDFTLALWINVDDLTVDRYLMARGLLNNDGWLFYVNTNGAVYFFTNQAAANQDTSSANNAITTNSWCQLVITRSGGVVLLYKNGVDITDAAGAHVNPTTSARKLHIGIHNGEVNNPFDGKMWNPRIWARRLSPTEVMRLFVRERDLFGV